MTRSYERPFAWPPSTRAGSRWPRPAGQVTSVTRIEQAERKVEALGASARWYGAPLTSVISGVGLVGPGSSPLRSQLFWRSGICGVLRFQQGGCPVGFGDVVMSARSAHELGVSVGATIDAGVTGTGRPLRLRLTGIYTVPDLSLPYWWGEGPAYFAFGQTDRAQRGAGARLADRLTGYGPGRARAGRAGRDRSGASPGRPGRPERRGRARERARARQRCGRTGRHPAAHPAARVARGRRSAAPRHVHDRGHRRRATGAARHLGPGRTARAQQRRAPVGDAGGTAARLSARHVARRHRGRAGCPVPARGRARDHRRVGRSAGGAQPAARSGRGHLTRRVGVRGPGRRGAGDRRRARLRHAFACCAPPAWGVARRALSPPGGARS